MSDFPRAYFSPGDSPQKLLDHKLLNWLMEKAAASISTSGDLFLSKNSYGIVLGLSKFITSLRPVELVEVLDAGGHALSHSLTLENDSDTFVIAKEENYPITVIDIFNTRSIIGTRGIALQVEFSTHGLWIFIPIGFAIINSSSSSASSQSGDDIAICDIAPPKPSLINGRIQGTIQFLGVDADGCWRLYSIGEGCSSSGA